MALDQRALAIKTRRLAVSDANTADFVFAGFGDEIPELLAGTFDRKTMQVEAALKLNLSRLQFAHLRILHTRTGPVEFVLSAHVDDELIG